ncbi:MAG: GntR family transcriptional regulator [Phycisphaerae bacterium]|nr:GntR family transcriptional regulator [Phycisphaerae bacterium]
MKAEKPISPVSRRSLSEQAAEHLREAILRGQIKPGQRIIEEEVAAMMQTSRGPIRDALILLEHEGLVVRERNRGATVVSLSAEDYEEVWSLRMALEGLALHGAFERADEDDLRRLEGVVDELAACLESDFSVQEAVDLDLRFHEELVNASHHRRLIAYWQGLRSQIWYLIFTRNIGEGVSYPREGHVYHKDLIEALRNKDLARGEELLRSHLDSAYSDLITVQKSRRKSKSGG